MGRGLGSKPRQAEKLLIVLIAANGGVVTLTEITATLGNTFPMYKLPTYLWVLKTMGAVLNKEKKGRNIIGLSLVNAEQMKTYAIARGIVQPPPVELKPEDLMT